MISEPKKILPKKTRILLSAVPLRLSSATIATTLHPALPCCHFPASGESTSATPLFSPLRLSLPLPPPPNFGKQGYYHKRHRLLPIMVTTMAAKGIEKDSKLTILIKIVNLDNLKNGGILCESARTILQSKYPRASKNDILQVLKIIDSVKKICGSISISL